MRKIILLCLVLAACCDRGGAVWDEVLQAARIYRDPKSQTEHCFTVQIIPGPEGWFVITSNNIGTRYYKSKANAKKFVMTLTCTTQKI